MPLLKIFVVFSTLFFSSAGNVQSERTGASFDELFRMATQTEYLPTELTNNKPLIWRDPKIRIGLFAEKGTKGSVVRNLSAAFKEDLLFIEEATGIDIQLSSWSDIAPKPSIFIYLGTADQILHAAPAIEMSFNATGYTKDMYRRTSNGESLCIPLVTVKRAGLLDKIVLIVDVNQTPQFCLRRQLIFAFGLVGKLPQDVKSILSTSTHYTGMDKSLLRVLYRSMKELNVD